MSEPIFRHPGRPVPKFRPFRAMHHFRKLIADKEDTEQVFHIFQCLPRLKLVDEDEGAKIGHDWPLFNARSS